MTATPSSPEPGVLAVIVGRAGSKGLPGKNALPLLGRPLITYTIDDARQAACVEDIVVSTDGEAIAAAAAHTGVRVVRRPAALAADRTPVVAAVRHAIDQMRSVPAVFVVLYANVPVRPDDLIDRAVATLHATGADSVQSYSAVGKHHPYWMVSVDDERRVRPFHPNRIDRRQDLPALHLPDGGVIVARGEKLHAGAADDPHAFLGDDRRAVLSPAGCVVDIDHAGDLRTAEACLTAFTAEAAS